jgi:hypothetical protein
MKHSSYYRKMRLFTYAVGALVVAVMATACGKKDEGGQVAVTPGGVSGSCVGCPKATTLLASGTGRSYSMGYGPVSGELSLQFYGDTATLATYGGAQYVGSYRGSVVAGGVFRNREARVSAGAWSGCNLPIGDYAISTTQPGQWSGQIFSTIGLSSTSGPVALTIRMNRNSITSSVPALVDYAGAQFPYHLVTEMEITSSAGGTCVYYIDGRF